MKRKYLDPATTLLIKGQKNMLIWSSHFINLLLCHLHTQCAQNKQLTSFQNTNRHLISKWIPIHIYLIFTYCTTFLKIWAITIHYNKKAYLVTYLPVQIWIKQCSMKLNKQLHITLTPFCCQPFCWPSPISFGLKKPQFYIQLVNRPHFGTWLLLFGPFGQSGQ